MAAELNRIASRPINSEGNNNEIISDPPVEVARQDSQADVQGQCNGF